MSSLKYDAVLGQHATFPGYILTGDNPSITLEQINGAIIYYSPTGEQIVRLPPGPDLVEELAMQTGDAVAFTLKNTGTGTATLDFAVGDNTVVFGPGAEDHAAVAAGSATLFTILCESFDPVELLVEAFPSGPSGISSVTLVADSGTATGSEITVSGGTTGLTTVASDATLDLTGTLSVNNGGTGAANLNGVVIGNGFLPMTAVNPLPVVNGGTGNNNISGVLLGNGTSAFTAQDPLNVNHGGTGAVSLTGVLVGNGTSPVTAVNPLNVANGGTGTSSLTGVVVGSGASSLTAFNPLNVANGGTGANTLTGVVLGNGTAPFTAVTPLTVANGGTGANTLTGVLIGNGTGAVTASAPLNVANGGTGATTVTGLAVGNGTAAFTGIGVISDLYFNSVLQLPAAGAVASFSYAPCSPFFQALGATVLGAPAGDGRIPLTTWQQVQDPTGTSFDNATGQYTLPVGGRWYIYASAMFSYSGASGAGVNLTLDIVNATEGSVLSSDMTQTTAAASTLGHFTTLRCFEMKNLAAGTVIRCTFSPNESEPVTYSLDAGVGTLQSQATKFGCWRISP